MRRIFLLSIILTGGLLIWPLINEKPQHELKATAIPAFELLGKPLSEANHALTRVIPIDETDEKEYGKILLQQYRTKEAMKHPAYAYVNRVLKKILPKKHKDLEFTVIVLTSCVPNAYALPGGVIFITDSLLAILQNEGQLAAILSHEVGHIELSDCLDTIRFELVAKKIKAETAGKIADILTTIAIRHTYSKSREDAADEYAFTCLIDSNYQLMSLSTAFNLLLKAEKKQGLRHSFDPLSAYLMTHPETENRAWKFDEKAKHYEDTNAKKREAGRKLKFKTSCVI